MPIVYRSTLGRPLTYGEMDGNFADLAARTDEAWAMDGTEPSVRDGAGNAPELKTFIGGVSEYAYAPSVMQECFSNWDIPFDWKVGTELYLAFHYAPGNSTATGNVRWGVEYTYASIGSAFGSTTTFFDVGLIAGTPYLHAQAISPPFDGALVNTNTRFLIRLFRDGDAVEDTYPDDVFLLGVDFFYQVNKFGLPSYLPPYP